VEEHKNIAASDLALAATMAKGYNFDRKRRLWGAAPKIVGCISPGGGVHLLFLGVFWGAN